jgi:reactive intermediate/imine deaminase
LTADDTNVRFLNPPELAPAPGYTQVVEVTGGRTIYVSGQIAMDRSGEVVGEGDLKAQTRQVFENLKAALAAAEAGFGDVVKLSYYLTDISQIAAVRGVRDEYVDTGNPPASTAVEVRRLFRKELLIEVEAVAVVQS